MFTEESHRLLGCWTPPLWWVLFGEHKEPIDTSTYPFPSTPCLWYCSLIHYRPLARIPFLASHRKWSAICTAWSSGCWEGIPSPLSFRTASEWGCDAEVYSEPHKHIMSTHQASGLSSFLFLHLAKGVPKSTGVWVEGDVLVQQGK